MDKHPNLIVHTTDPINAEPPLDALRENFITPQDLFYVRNHGNIPAIDVKNYRLHVSGMVERELELTLDTLRNNFSNRSVMATVQCAGNRRNQLIEVAEIPGEVPWQEGAIGNTIWTGIPLREVLAAAGVKESAHHVEFIGGDEVFRKGENVGFGGSIPIDKAMRNEVLLAHEMNGNPLEPIHGFPLRTIVPGYIGARSVKWLRRITLQEKPSENYFQSIAYRLFPAEVNAKTVDSHPGIQLNELSVNCVITSPMQGAVTTENILVQGYAMSGERKITRIDVSCDGGKNWITATITHSDHQWAWIFWEASLKLENGEHEIIARAFDTASNTQPERARYIWNFKGYMNNAWHRVKVSVKK
jgi:sulfite oxidase